jgi:hypothetical protein
MISSQIVYGFDRTPLILCVAFLLCFCGDDRDVDSPVDIYKNNKTLLTTIKGKLLISGQSLKDSVTVDCSNIDGLQLGDTLKARLFEFCKLSGLSGSSKIFIDPPNYLSFLIIQDSTIEERLVYDGTNFLSNVGITDDYIVEHIEGNWYSTTQYFPPEYYEVDK